MYVCLYSVLFCIFYAVFWWGERVCKITLRICSPLLPQQCSPPSSIQHTVIFINLHDLATISAPATSLDSSRLGLFIGLCHHLKLLLQQHIYRQQHGAAFYWQARSDYIYKSASNISRTFHWTEKTHGRICAAENLNRVRSTDQHTRT